MKRALTCPLFTISLCLATTSHAQWTPTGVPACTAQNAQSVAVACPDGTGGVIVVWNDARNTYPPHSSGDTMGDLYAQRLNAAGVPQWTANGVVICAGTLSMPATNYPPRSYPCIVSDGAGGAIIAWLDYRFDYDIYAQRVDGSGAVQWAVNGVRLTGLQQQKNPVMTTDGTGGAIVAWMFQDEGRAYIQRINSAGIPLWASGGIWAHLPVTFQNETVEIASDGAGGAIVTGVGNDNVIPPALYSDIYAQRIMSDGSNAWGFYGVKATSAFYYQQEPVIVESNGGAIIAWRDQRATPQVYHIYAQRLDSAGAVQWAPDGVAIRTVASWGLNMVITSDGAGGAILAWDDSRTSNDFNSRDIYAQRVSIGGLPQWTPNGIAICDLGSQQIVPKITSDGQGGAIVAWTDERGVTSSIFAQRIQSSGTFLWPDDGLGIETNPQNQFIDESATPTVVSDLGGGAIFVYTNNPGPNADIFAQHVSGSGAIPTGVGPSKAPSFALSEGYPNPFSAETFFDLTLERDTRVSIDVFDATGKRVRATETEQRKAGPTRLDFDGLDGHSRPLPSGIYFYRVRAGDEMMTKKIVIAR